MALKKVRVCDVCRGVNDIDTLTVVYKFKQGKPWEVDICPSCYEGLLGELAKKGRRATINNVRPQHRMVKTEITDENL